MLGALSAISGIVTTDKINEAIEKYMPLKLNEKNKKAVGNAVGEVLE